MANIESSAPTIVGTENDDIIIATHSTGTGDNVIFGFGGNDVIFGDHDSVFSDLGSGNTTMGSAINIDASGAWSTKSNPDIGNTAVPYTSILAVGAGQLDYFSVTIGAGQTITLDIDYAAGNLGGPSFDSKISLLSNAGAVLASNDDASASLGGRGSTTNLDSYLTFTPTTGGNYFIRVEQFNDIIITAGSTYMLNVSVTGHANTNVADFGADSIEAGTGNDLIYGIEGNDTLSGQEGHDTILGGSGNDEIWAGADNDSVDGGSGSDTIQGGEGVDTLLGGGGNDSIHAFFIGFTSGIAPENSFLDGGPGNDTLQGIDGNDTILGGSGHDSILGGRGKDLLQGGTGSDLLNGDAGRDTINGQDGHDKIDGGNSNDALRGGKGIDTLIGGSGDDLLAGGNNSDILSSGAGNDTLQGQGGRDRLNGGRGDDKLIGGSSADRFVFANNYDSDRITDFTNNVDTLLLNDNLWGGGLSAQQVINMFASSAGGNTTFNFGGGDDLKLIGISNPNVLADDIIIV